MHYFKLIGNPEGYRELWENREALDKYLKRLKELMGEDSDKNTNFDSSKWLNNSHDQFVSMVRAKFKCNYATVTEYGPDPKQINKRFNFSAVYGSKGENATFSKLTPAGTLDITVDEGTTAFTEFVPGNEYYLDFTPVPKPEVKATGIL